MAITRKTQALVNKRNASQKRQRVAQSLAGLGKTLADLQDRKRAIEKEEEELRFRLTEAERRQTRFEKGLATEVSEAEKGRTFGATEAEKSRAFTAEEGEKNRAAAAEQGKLTREAAAARQQTAIDAPSDVRVRVEEFKKGIAGDAGTGAIRDVIDRLSTKVIRSGQPEFPEAVLATIDEVLFGSQNALEKFLTDASVGGAPVSSSTAKLLFEESGGLLGAFPKEVHGELREAFIKKFIEKAATFGVAIDPAEKAAILGELSIGTVTGPGINVPLTRNPELELEFSQGFDQNTRKARRQATQPSTPDFRNVR
jgi:hypothetical protein